MCPYNLKYTFSVSQQFIVPKPQHLIPLFFKPYIPLSIFLFFCRLGMLPSVQFDNQFLFETHKINNVVSYRLLSLEFEACKSLGS